MRTLKRRRVWVAGGKRYNYRDAEAEGNTIKLDCEAAGIIVSLDELTDPITAEIDGRGIYWSDSPSKHMLPIKSRPSDDHIADISELEAWSHDDVSIDAGMDVTEQVQQMFRRHRSPLLRGPAQKLLRCRQEVRPFVQ